MRLTRQIRKVIREGVIKFKFADREKDLSAASQAHGMACYDRLFTPEERKLIDSLPGGWVPSSIRGKFAFGGRQSVVWFGDYRRVTKKMNDTSQALLTLAADDPLSVEFQRLENLKDDLRLERRRLEADLTAVLESVHTDTALLKLWPEAARWIPSTPARVHGLPAVIIDDLNAKIGL